ncbi:hypothetical protein [Neolewinella sp.]|uniref:hypothetical protein n=1 Tax=Neolewinella sp. TaxID=2993543 RepID=UPI003B52A053
MRYLAFVLLLGAVACTTPQVSEPSSSSQKSQASPYADRIAAATTRLSTSDPARKVLRAIDAMGGLENWYGNGPLYYHFDYQPLDGSTPRNTYVTNDYRSAKAVHLYAGDSTLRFGFDGQEAWSMTGEKVEGMSPRFWSLTPYYFVGLPFVLADAGINFAALPPAELDGTIYDMVKVTFDAGTGDASGDYYVLYLNPNSGQLDALRYVVTYPGYFPHGGSTPEKLMVLTGKTTVGGVTLPTGYLTSMWNDGAVSGPVTRITVSDYAFKPELGDEFFARPVGARVYNDLPE